MGYAISLAIALTLLWLGLSGLMKPIVLTLGVISIAVTVFLSARLGLLDREGAPYHRMVQMLRYAPWLFKEIISSNIRVLKAILSPDLDIHPTLVKVPYSMKSDLSKVMFANSITLTPGTVTLRVDDGFMLVHGLYESGAQPEAFEEMHDRTAHAGEGRPMPKGKAK